ncbi:unnamed protein product [Rotaria sp. Silwood1]|nr:unnamed protein product [Rotaria sp. Silwood1]CAF1275134.1 unnamed protein product [Rotaria sp. Silwood1]CAF1350517.1 unnamed protein product [Rotaria sp. Silwood1]CAF3484097.1 unnamed protein product [Rotaria sp. Silwood1]CAF3581363.1 unnamed protein product [Rotaria sp. Silwood1]
MLIRTPEPVRRSLTLANTHFVRQDLILPRFSSSRSTIRRTTVTALTSTISLPVSSNLNENNLNINE